MLQVVAYPVGGRWLGGSCTRTWSRLPITAATDTATYTLTNLLTYYLLLTTHYSPLQRIVALETAMSMPPGAHSSGSWLVRIAALEAEANERLL